MAHPRLIDAVVLRHFGAINRMAVLGERLVHHSPPHWTGAVHEEVLSHYEDDDCKAVLEADFLGNPFVVPMTELSEVFRIRRALSTGHDSPERHLGEAESIWVADRFNGAFVTDDYEAFAFAEKRLGDNRVLDTVDLLREAVAARELQAGEAKQIVDAIRNLDRHLRPGHPPTITADYFV
jgi:hypothetical protein